MTHVSGAEGEGNWMRLMVPVDEEGKGKALGFSCDGLQLTGMLCPDLSLCSQQPHTVEISPYHSPHPGPVEMTCFIGGSDRYVRCLKIQRS